MARRGGGAVIEVQDASRAVALAEVVCGLYREVFSLSPFDGTEEEFAGQRAYYPRLVHRPGFRLVTARAGGGFVGFAYGHLLPADTGWWGGLSDPVDAGFAAETGTRTFVIIDFGVAAGWRGVGVGRAIHDELLAGCGARRASLTVQPTAVDTIAVYHRWGWRTVGRKEMDPPTPFPRFDVMLLEPLPG